MMRTRFRRGGAPSAWAVARLVDIEASILSLADEDLLDLADIFADEAGTPLGEIATAELVKRNLSL